MKHLFNVMLVACALVFTSFVANANPVNDSEKQLPTATPGKELSKPSMPVTPTIPVELSKPETAIDNAISAPSKDSTGKKNNMASNTAKYSVENINSEKAAVEKKAEADKVVRKAKKHTKRHKRATHKKRAGKTHKKEASTIQNDPTTK